MSIKTNNNNNNKMAAKGLIDQIAKKNDRNKIINKKYILG